MTHPMQDLIDEARSVLGVRPLSGGEAGSVAAALETADGHVYRGVCIDVGSSMGFCAEHAAIAAMVTSGETRIRRCVAVHTECGAVAPCGRCREFMAQLCEENLDADIGLHEGTAKLRELLPHCWTE